MTVGHMGGCTVADIEADIAVEDTEDTAGTDAVTDTEVDTGENIEAETTADMRVAE